MKYISGSFLPSGELDWKLRNTGELDAKGITIGFTINSPRGQRDALTKLAHRLNDLNVNWLRPIGNVMEKWLLNLDEIRIHFENVADSNWAHGTVAVIPEYEIEKRISRPYDSYLEDEDGWIEFVITPEEMERIMIVADFPELEPFLEKFWDEHQEPEKCGFLMMKFDNTKLHRVIVDAIRTTCSTYGIEVLRADDKAYSDDLLPNIRTYMHGCGFGIAVYERLVADEFNPNVSLEVGYMMALGKPVLFLKDATLHFLQTDLVGRLYETFDVQSPNETISPVLEKWLRKKSIIERKLYATYR